MHKFSGECSRENFTDFRKLTLFHVTRYSLRVKCVTTALISLPLPSPPLPSSPLPTSPLLSPPRLASPRLAATRFSLIDSTVVTLRQGIALREALADRKLSTETRRQNELHSSWPASRQIQLMAFLRCA